jgi:3-dehydroquinate synthase
MRGIPLVQVPTTLLAQVDSSVGGKTAVNLPEGKNLVGCFYQPRLVLIDPSTLRTLPQREFRAGLAEVIKTVFLTGGGSLVYFENHLEEILALKPEVLTEIILRCCQFKARVVEADERDVTDQRAILNYGHTIGHALEVLTGYGQLLHGEAVSIGMLGAALISFELGLVPKELVESHYLLITRAGLPVQLPKVNNDQVIEQLSRDKKKIGDKVYFVLLKGPGQPVVAEVPTDVIRAVLNRMSPKTGTSPA